MAVISLRFDLLYARMAARSQQDTHRPTAQAVVFSPYVAGIHGSGGPLFSSRPIAEQLGKGRQQGRNCVLLQRLSKTPKEQPYYSHPQDHQRSTDHGLFFP